MDRCLSFGMQILGYDPFVNEDILSEKDITLMNLDEIVKMSDFISLHIPLMLSSHEMEDWAKVFLTNDVKAPQNTQWIPTEDH